jgi:hypothetical protein
VVYEGFCRSLFRSMWLFTQMYRRLTCRDVCLRSKNQTTAHSPESGEHRSTGAVNSERRFLGVIRRINSPAMVSEWGCCIDEGLAVQMKWWLSTSHSRSGADGQTV